MIWGSTERAKASEPSRLAAGARAAWLGVAAAATALDAVAAGGVAWTHGLFLACGCAGVAVEAVLHRRPALADAAATAAWLLAGSLLTLTAADGGGAFAAILSLPALFALAGGRPLRAVIEAAALGAFSGLLLLALSGLARPAWDYGVLPNATAMAVGVFALSAAAELWRRRRRAAATASAASRRRDALLEASPDVFLSIGPNDRIVFALGGGPGKFVHDAATFIGTAAGGLFAPSETDRFARALDRVRRIGAPERLVLAGDGGLVEARLVRTEARELLLALRPASAEVEALPVAERERDAAEAAARARSRFFASMSHELRTPLNAVLGFSEAMRLKLFGPLSAKYAEYAEDIHNSAKMLLDLVGDLLDVSRIEAGRYELEVSRFDAREAAHAAARMMRPAADAGQIEFEVDAGEAPIDVEGDLRALKQMLLNLTSNAVKFTPAGGSVRLAMRTEGGALVAEVSDTGPGLTPEEIDRLAQPFEQTRSGRAHDARSSGLGLALVRSLCDIQGGRLEIESEPGVGATFRVRLPVLAGNESPDESMDARGRLQRIKDAGFAETGEGGAT